MNEKKTQSNENQIKDLEKDKMWLEYDKQIWTIFSVGVISSVIILYETFKPEFNKDFIIHTLILGFSILVYCFFAIDGYKSKRKGYGKDLEKKNYLRSRWMGEVILGFIGVFYLIAFCRVNLAFIFIPIGIVFTASFMSIVAYIFAD